MKHSRERLECLNTNICRLQGDMKALKNAMDDAEERKHKLSMELYDTQCKLNCTKNELLRAESEFQCLQEELALCECQAESAERKN